MQTSTKVQVSAPEETCPVCKGKKTVTGPSGELTCHRCRGKGTVKGQLQTK